MPETGYLFLFTKWPFSPLTGDFHKTTIPIHLLDFILPEYHDQAKKNFQRVMEGGEGSPCELRQTGTGGQVRIVEMKSSPVRDIYRSCFPAFRSYIFYIFS